MARKSLMVWSISSMAEDTSTHTLLVRLKHGYGNVAEILYQRHAQEFYNYALRQGLIREDAEDAVEEIFDRVLTSISSYNEAICGGEKWMWSICRHKVTDKLRERKKQGVELSEAYPSSRDTNPETYFDQQERIQAVNQAWQKISEADRREIRRGRGRGPGRKEWHEAIKRLRPRRISRRSASEIFCQ